MSGRRSRKVPYTVIVNNSDVAQRVVEVARLERPMVPTECHEGIFEILKQYAGQRGQWIGRILLR